MPDDQNFADSAATPVVGAPVADTPVADAAAADAPAAPLGAVDSPAPDPAIAPSPDPVANDASTQSDVVVAPTPSPEVPAKPATMSKSEIYAEVAGKISDSHNVLIALSSDPSVDEMAAAIGLSLYLDRLGKRATAIYSGSTPNALEFLNPEETFESTADTLQDFVIALDKEKADHLRYKLDGEFVKIYITPYKTRISEDDLDFSYGDFNVDLVLSLDVANGIDLDSALREHGRITHNAVIINVTTGNPGKFGEIEWSDKSASSISEMIAAFLYSVNSKVKIEKEEATAFLTGIVAATNRFSNASTTPATMEIASRLMKSGANQQLVSKNITPDIENEMFSMLGSENHKKFDDDPTKLSIDHNDEIQADETKIVDGTVTEKESSLLSDLKAAEASLAQAGAEVTPALEDRPVKLETSSSPADSLEAPIEPVSEPSVEASVESPVETSEENLAAASPASSVSEPDSSEVASTEADSPTHLEDENSGFIKEQPEKVLQPSADFNAGASGEGAEKYSKMIEDAVANIGDGTSAVSAENSAIAAEMNAATNPAAMNAPAVSPSPEINGVPEMNYLPTPDESILPPPPTPPIDMASSPAQLPTEPITPASPSIPAVAPIEPAVPASESEPTSLGAQPSMQDQVYSPQASDPSAFKIPGM